MVSVAFISAGIEPVVGRAGVVLRLRADVGLVLDAGDVGGSERTRIELGRFSGLSHMRGAAVDEGLQESLIFGLGAVAPDDLLGLEQGFRLLDESQHLGVGGLRTFGRNLRLNTHAG